MQPQIRIYDKPNAPTDLPRDASDDKYPARRDIEGNYILTHKEYSQWRRLLRYRYNARRAIRALLARDKVRQAELIVQTNYNNDAHKIIQRFRAYNWTFGERLIFALFNRTPRWVLLGR